MIRTYLPLVAVVSTADPADPVPPALPVLPDPVPVVPSVPVPAAAPVPELTPVVSVGIPVVSTVVSVAVESGYWASVAVSFFLHEKASPANTNKSAILVLNSVFIILIFLIIYN
jgi:hypothetical protein